MKKTLQSLAARRLLKATPREGVHPAVPEPVSELEGTAISAEFSSTEIMASLVRGERYVI